MNLVERSELKRAEVRQLGPLDLRGLTPSLKDFTQALAGGQGGLGVIAELARQTDEEGVLCEQLDLRRWVSVLERCELAAIAVSTDRSVRGQFEDLSTVAATASSPVLMHDWVVSREQVYRARLFGADAVLLSAEAVSANELRALVEIAASLHMAAAIEIQTRDQLGVAVAVGARVAVVPAFGPRGLDLTSFEALFPSFPRTLSAVVRGPFQGPEQLGSLRGRAQAIWTTGPLMRAANPEEWLRSLVEAAENGP